MALAPAVGNQVRFYNNSPVGQIGWLTAFTNDNTNTIEYVILPDGNHGHPSRVGETGVSASQVLTNIPRLGTTQHWSVMHVPVEFGGY